MKKTNLFLFFIFAMVFSSGSLFAMLSKFKREDLDPIENNSVSKNTNENLKKEKKNLEKEKKNLEIDLIANTENFDDAQRSLKEKENAVKNLSFKKIDVIMELAHKKQFNTAQTKLQEFKIELNSSSLSKKVLSLINSEIDSKLTEIETLKTMELFITLVNVQYSLDQKIIQQFIETVQKLSLEGLEEDDGEESLPQEPKCEPKEISQEKIYEKPPQSPMGKEPTQHEPSQEDQFFSELGKRLEKVKGIVEDLLTGNTLSNKDLRKLLNALKTQTPTNTKGSHNNIVIALDANHTVHKTLIAPHKGSSLHTNSKKLREVFISFGIKEASQLWPK
jgi:hypothetical protein